MGRHDLRPLRVHSTAKKLLTADRISNLPSWHSVIDSIPPAQTLVRTQRIQHAKQRKTQKPKAQKIGKIFQPSRIAYEEDKLRKKFFGDHPWELARPRLVLESDGRDYEKNDWSRLPQTGRSANGESVVQRQMWLQENNTNITSGQAYDQARKEFYHLRLQEDVQRRVAKEEALATGAYFHRSTLDVGMELEDKQYEEWKAWALKEANEAEQRRNAMYTGQNNESMDLSPDDPETEAGLDEVADVLPALGGAPAIPAGQGFGTSRDVTLEP